METMRVAPGAVTPQPRPADTAIELWTADPDAFGLDACAALLSTDETARAARMAPAPRTRFVIVRGLLRQVLASYLDIDPRSVALATARHGKPQLADAADPLRFNVAHTDGCALIAAATRHEIGVDVEHRRALSDALALARRSFAADEAAAIAALDGAARDAAFLALWVRKEAAGKALGVGLAQVLTGGLASLTVGAAPCATPRAVTVMGSALLLQDMAVSDDHVAAVAWLGAPATVTLRRLVP